MEVFDTALPGVLVLEPRLFSDERGFVFESFNARRFADATGSHVSFVQDNHSSSGKNVLRGVHYQIGQPQGKLVRVVAGEVFDVAVDLRRSSRHFGRWAGVRLSAQNRKQLWIPPGFGHGFLIVSDVAEVLYKMTDYWAPEHERCIAWDDDRLAIDWPLDGTPRLSAKDAAGVRFDDADVFD